MNHADHVALIQEAVVEGTWVDLGSGLGAFTLALADLLVEGSTIYSIDKDGYALQQQQELISKRFPHLTIHYQQADFTRPLNLPPLDGILIANALHFHAHKLPLLLRFHHDLKPSGRLVIVEYNVEKGNTWVPYPFSYPQWEKLAQQAGFVETRLLMKRPSRFLNEIYSAVSHTPPQEEA